MHAVQPREDNKDFYEQLYTALKDPIVATIHHQELMPDKELRHMLEDAVNGKKDVVPALVYYDNGWNEDLPVNIPEMVNVASIASLVTGNIAVTVEYDFDHKYYRRDAKVVYRFSV